MAQESPEILYLHHLIPTRDTSGRSEVTEDAWSEAFSNDNAGADCQMVGSFHEVAELFERDGKELREFLIRN